MKHIVNTLLQPFKKAKYYVDPEFKVGDELYYYYTFPDTGPYNGEKGVVKFTVKKIHMNSSLTENCFTTKYQYEGSKYGCNYYGVADENLCAKTIKDLTEKLLALGYSFN